MPRKRSTGTMQKKTKRIPGLSEAEQADLDRYTEAGDRWLKRVTASPEAARRELQRLGILNRKGNLHKNYR